MDRASSLTQTAVSLEMTPNEMQDLIKLYATNPVFRSASAEELVVTDNPYRRAVRPEDLDFLDYRLPLKTREALDLRALIAHRMLRNIYEAELLFLPKGNGLAAWQDFERFYSPHSRMLSERARSTLEAHVFTFLSEDGAESADKSADTLKKEVFAAQQSAHAMQSLAIDTILGAHDRQSVATTYLIQLLATYRSEAAALARGMAGEYDGSVVGLSRFFFGSGDTYGTPAVARSTLLKRLVRSCGLHDEVHAYWQFYLTSSLALANYAYYVSRDPSKFFRAVGSRVYREVQFACCREQQSEMLHTIFGPEVDTQYFDAPAATEQEVIDALITPLLDQYGERVVNEIARGFQECQQLHEIASNDFITQVTWADQPDFYKEKARQMYETIRTRNLRVHLDTFVELSSETSTTHTHDVHRLLVIETGKMYFWSAFGPPMLFGPGDMTFIPRQRLHGSTVISDECIYHQPVISSRLMRELDQLV